jgi:hypothetical protein
VTRRVSTGVDRPVSRARSGALLLGLAYAGFVIGLPDGLLGVAAPSMLAGVVMPTTRGGIRAGRPAVDTSSTRAGKAAVA